RRDLALAELTGAHLIVDQLSSAGGLEALRRAKDRGVLVHATVSINHLSFNEIDIGDYRTFYKLVPPLRAEEDRQALIEALASGLIDVVVSAHAPAPAEDKRLPFDEAAPGAIGLETLLPALLTLFHEGRGSLIDLMAAVTAKPAKLLGLDAGTLAAGAPADLILCDIGAPVRIDADKLISKSKNSPFDGRSLQGKVLMTLVDGRIVHRS
ncbi:MAG TPA: amidohydrolase family protein, partial [Caulobacteraceae bacterium]|nr:amidohydrolase family protein [Caulobacteraceae bacterium]